MEKYEYTPSGVCSRKIYIELDGDIIKDISFTGGCQGNLRGISALTRGMNIHDAINRLKGINCGGKGTSCPDQLSKALEAVINNR